jgi:hypothetical protein
MPNFAVLSNNKVVNIVVAESDYAATQGWVAAPAGVSIGFDFTNNQFIDNRPPVTEPTPAPEPTKAELLAQLQALSDRIDALA